MSLTPPLTPVDPAVPVNRPFGRLGPAVKRGRGWQAFLLGSALALALAGQPAVVFAQEAPAAPAETDGPQLVEVQFFGGEAEYRALLRPGDQIDYLVPAKAGETLHADVISETGDVVFDITKGDLSLWSADQGTVFVRKLPEDGPWTIRLRGAEPETESAFRLYLGLDGIGAEEALTPDTAEDEVVLSAEAAEQAASEDTPEGEEVAGVSTAGDEAPLKEDMAADPAASGAELDAASPAEAAPLELAEAQVSTRSDAAAGVTPIVDISAPQVPVLPKPDAPPFGAETPEDSPADAASPAPSADEKAEDAAPKTSGGAGSAEADPPATLEGSAEAPEAAASATAPSEAAAETRDPAAPAGSAETASPAAEPEVSGGEAASVVEAGGEKASGVATEEAASPSDASASSGETPAGGAVTGAEGEGEAAASGAENPPSSDVGAAPAPEAAASAPDPENPADQSAPDAGAAPEGAGAADQPAAETAAPDAESPAGQPAPEGAAAAPELVQPGAPAADGSGPNYYRAANLSGAMLNLRRGPSRSEPIVSQVGEGRLLQGESCQQGGDFVWCRVTAVDDPAIWGWGAEQFLDPAEPPTGN